MPPPDILHFLNTSDFMRRWVEVHPGMNRTRLLRWMGEQVGLSREQMWALIYGDGARIQADAVAQFARMFELDDERREYLRRLVYQESCDRQHLSEARLAVWEMHAAATGVPLDAIPALMEDDDAPGADEAAVLALLPLVLEVVRSPEAAEISSGIRGGPAPAVVEAALAAHREGVVLGEAGFRKVNLPEPGRADDWETLCWHGLYRLARESLLRPALGVRDLHLMIGAVDDRAMVEVRKAEVRILSALDAILRKTSLHRPRRITALLSSVVVLTPPSGGFDGRLYPQTAGSRRSLPDANAAIIQGEGETSSVSSFSERPCIYHHLSFLSFIRSVVGWRSAARLPTSAAWFGRELGMSKSQAHALMTGAAVLLPRHVSDVAAALELDEDAAVYLEGMVRFQTATDLQDKARERLALIAFAEKRGVRTWEGESFRVAAHWAPWAILALADRPDFRTNPGWITRILGGRLLPDDARALVRVLLDMGFLVPQELGPPRPSTAERHSMPPEVDLQRYALHDSALRQLCTELRVPPTLRRLRGRVLALPDEALPGVQAALVDYRERIMDAARAADARARAGVTRLETVLLFTTHHIPLISETHMR